MKLENLRTFEQILEECSFLTEWRLREQLRRRDSNGLAAAVTRAPGTQRLLIDRSLYEQWLTGELAQAAAKKR